MPLGSSHQPRALSGCPLSGKPPMQSVPNPCFLVLRKVMASGPGEGMGGEASAGRRAHADPGDFGWAGVTH